MTAQEFIAQGAVVSRVLHHVGVHSSTFYYRPKPGKRGRSASLWTVDRHGRRWSEQEVVQVIEELLSQEFVDYGYYKVTLWLQRRKGLLINKKKVYRIMKQAHLLHGRSNRPDAARLRVVEAVPKPLQPLQHLEFDIKFMHVHGQRRNALMLTVIDVMSRFNLGWAVQWSLRKRDAAALFDRILRQLPSQVNITVRSDNGSQFVSRLLRDFFRDRDVKHEFIRPATPDENAHIESYHSIVQRAICDRFEFASLEHLQQTIGRFVDFYNFDRIHCGIAGKTPSEVLHQYGLEMRSMTLPVSPSNTLFFQPIN